MRFSFYFRPTGRRFVNKSNKHYSIVQLDENETDRFERVLYVYFNA